MEISVLKLVFIIIGSVILWDFIRLLIFKLLSKKMRLFAIVPDTEQLRLKHVSESLDIPVTKIVVDENKFFDIDNPDKIYKITCGATYIMDLVDSEGNVIERDIRSDKNFNTKIIVETEEGLDLKEIEQTENVNETVTETEVENGTKTKED